MASRGRSMRYRGQGQLWVPCVRTSFSGLGPWSVVLRFLKCPARTDTMALSAGTTKSASLDRLNPERFSPSQRKCQAFMSLSHTWACSLLGAGPPRKAPNERCNRETRSEIAARINPSFLQAAGCRQGTWPEPRSGVASAFALPNRARRAAAGRCVAPDAAIAMLLGWLQSRDSRSGRAATGPWRAPRAGARG